MYFLCSWASPPTDPPDFTYEAQVQSVRTGGAEPQAKHGPFGARSRSDPEAGAVGVRY